MIQAISVLAALVVLVAYAANQFGLIGPSNLSYTLLNLLGAVVLASIAVIEAQWGFLLQEGAWTLVSLLALVKLLKGAVKDTNGCSNRALPEQLERH